MASRIAVLRGHLCGNRASAADDATAGHPRDDVGTSTAEAAAAAITAPGPLSGIVVLEVANWIAGPCCGALLADLGAEVIKVEPPEGDSMRYTLRQPQPPNAPKRRPGDAIDFPHQVSNRGKRSIAIDLEGAEGQKLVHDLARRADVFLTNLTPPRLERYDLAPARLRALNQRLIVAAVSGWGLSGPKRDENSFDVTAFFAHGGVMSLLGEPGDNPVKPVLGQGDHTTGLAALGGVLSALLLRQRTGQGCVVEASLLRTASWTVASELANALVDGVQPKARTRFDSPNVASNTYKCSDGRWLILVMPFPRYWDGLCKALGKPEWAAKDHVYSTPRGRSQRRDALVREMDAIFATATLAEWRDRLDAHHCIYSPLHDLPTLAADEQADAAGCFTWVEHEHAGRFRTINTPFGVHAGEGVFVGARGCAPSEPGADTDAVLGQTLGLGAAEVAELRRKGIVGHRPAKGSPLERWAATRASAAQAQAQGR